MNKRRDLRILWNSNGVWTNSGYAVEQRELLSRLSSDGWPTAQISFWGLLGNTIEKYIDPPFDKGNEIKLYHKLSEDYGTDAMYHHAKDFKADVVFSMMDVPSLNPAYLAKMNQEGIKWIPWLPIDHDPIPPAVLDRLRYAYKIITFSKFGHDLLEKEGYTSKLILEGTNTALYKPMDKIEARKLLNLPPDIFLFGMIAANKENPPRKGFQEALEAFAIFEKNHPNAYLWLHTQQLSPTSFPILEYARHLGIIHKIIYFDQHKATFYANYKEVIQQLSAIDILLHPSQTEGFGLTIVEAQSCGRPVLINDCTSMPELIIDGVTGEKCKVKHKFWSNQNGYQFVADSDDLAQKMELLWQRLQKDEKKISKACRQNIIKNFNINTLVRNEWLPYLEALQEEVLGAKIDKEDNPIVTMGL